MGLRIKTIAIVACIFAGIIGAIHLIFSQHLLKQVKEFEHTLVLKNVERINQAFVAIGSNARDRVLDWGHWTDTEDFVLGKNPDYIEANLTYAAMEAFETKHFLFLKRDGTIFHSGKLIESKEMIVPVGRSEANEILRQPKIVDFFKRPNDEGITGLMMVEGEPIVVAVSTITDNYVSKRRSGFLIFTRALSETMKEQIAQQTQLPISFHLEDEKDILGAISAPTPLRFNETAELLNVTSAIPDISGKQIMTAHFLQSREILGRSEEARRSLMIIVGVFLMVVSGVILWLLDKMVLKPLQNLASDIEAISKTSDLTRKLEVGSTNEIGRVAQVFNSLLESLDASYQRLFEAKSLAQQSSEGKSKFIAAVSHELRTPIQSITGMLRILRKNESTESKLAYIKLASDAAFGLSDTINEILDFAKIEAGQLPLETRHFHLRDVLKKSLRDSNVCKRTEAGPIELLYDIAPEVPDLMIGDPRRLGQILTNLLGNAGKFTTEGEIELSVTAAKSSKRGQSVIVFTVRDTGIGISAQQLPHIFSPFYQVRSAATSVTPGTGLGLAIVKQLVTQMDGDISIRSTPQKGTTFTVTVPFDLGDSSSSSIVRQELQTQRIALITSSSKSAVFVHDALVKQGHTACLIEPSQEIEWEKCLKNSDHVVLWDTIPAKLGQLREIISTAQGLDIPIVAVVNPAELSIRDDLTRLGIRSFVLQPASADDLLRSFGDGGIEDVGRSGEIVAPPLEAEAPLKILVADDMPTNCLILRTLLEEVGHTVEVVGNGVDLLNRLRPIAIGDPLSNPIDIVLTDIQMPLMDGDRAVKRVRLIEECSGSNQHLPIIAVTARALPEEIRQMKLCGIDEVMTKPINEEELLRLIKVYTGRSGRCVSAEQNTKPLHETLASLVTELSQDGDLHPLASSQRIPLIDIEDIFERSRGSLGNTRMILSLFISSYQELRANLERSAGAGDVLDIYRSIHSLKGVLLDAGAHSTAEFVEQWEEHARRLPAGAAYTGQTEELLTRVDVVVAIAEKLIQELPEGAEALPQ